MPKKGTTKASSKASSKANLKTTSSRVSSELNLPTLTSMQVRAVAQKYHKFFLKQYEVEVGGELTSLFLHKILVEPEAASLNDIKFGFTKKLSRWVETIWLTIDQLPFKLEEVASEGE